MDHALLPIIPAEDGVGTVASRVDEGCLPFDETRIMPLHTPSTAMRRRPDFRLKFKAHPCQTALHSLPKLPLETQSDAIERALAF
jgi:hypothetical protein